MMVEIQDSGHGSHVNDDCNMHHLHVPFIIYVHKQTERCRYIKQSNITPEIFFSEVLLTL
jgi:hypothetical protein